MLPDARGDVEASAPAAFLSHDPSGGTEGEGGDEGAIQKHT